MIPPCPTRQQTQTLQNKIVNAEPAVPIHTYRLLIVLPTGPLIVP